MWCPPKVEKSSKWLWDIEFTFSALTLLAGCQEGNMSCKNLSVGTLVAVYSDAGDLAGALHILRVVCLFVLYASLLRHPELPDLVQ